MGKLIQCKRARFRHSSFHSFGTGLYTSDTWTISTNNTKELNISYYSTLQHKSLAFRSTIHSYLLLKVGSVRCGKWWATANHTLYTVIHAKEQLIECRLTNGAASTHCMSSYDCITLEPPSTTVPQRCCHPQRDVHSLDQEYLQWPFETVRCVGAGDSCSSW